MSARAVAERIDLLGMPHIGCSPTRSVQVGVARCGVDGGRGLRGGVAAVADVWWLAVRVPVAERWSVSEGMWW